MAQPSISRQLEQARETCATLAAVVAQMRTLNSEQYSQLHEMRQRDFDNRESQRTISYLRGYIDALRNNAPTPIFDPEIEAVSQVAER